MLTPPRDHEDILSVLSTYIYILSTLGLWLTDVDRGLEETLTVSNFRKIIEVSNTNIHSTAAQETKGVQFKPQVTSIEHNVNYHSAIFGQISSRS